MLRDIYLRPIGLFPSAVSDQVDEVWDSLNLAGGWLDFTAIEAIERNGSRIERRIVGLSGFLEKDWGRRTLTAADLFEAVRAPRPRIAGLALDRPRIMGIVNVTPDSFSDGGKTDTTAAAIAHGLRLVEEGADILDIGGESTRPGADAVSIEDELRRVIPVIEGLSDKADALISIDTRKPEVMRIAAEAGADILNDVSALTYDPRSLETAAELAMPTILMHAQGDPRTMQQNPTYDNVLLDVFDFLEARVEAAVKAGLGREKIIVDPGLGFGKMLLEHNLPLLSGLTLFHALGAPLMVGASRKGFIGALSGVKAAFERVHGSVAAALMAVNEGAQIVRVHDVGATRQALNVMQAARGGKVQA
jgi:dihydropteroate synthase